MVLNLNFGALLADVGSTEVTDPNGDGTVDTVDIDPFKQLGATLGRRLLGMLMETMSYSRRPQRNPCRMG